ncbi:exo-alpha-sialidase [Consotaella aegiceratis]|uniref:exo-alpha-sialidase n=1 Tax=Consotaella aegiceratis TaxID=3097961 RepID=UPI002F41C32A
MGVSGWTVGTMANLPHEGDITRELEPSWFRRADGAAVMVFRDQGDTFHKLAAVSTDRGVTWSDPVETAMPDARTKQSAGNLPDGTAFLVGNPTGTKFRFPLAIALSDDGRVFDHAYLLRDGGADMQKQRFKGKAKRPSYAYPKSIVWGDDLYVAYATNKEDAEVTRIPLKSLTIE